MPSRPLVAITMGDPVGIGPEIIVRALAGDQIYRCCRPLVVGSVAVLIRAAEICRAPLTFEAVSRPDDAAQVLAAGQVPVLTPPDGDPGPTHWGRPTPLSGRAMETYITTAVDLALAGAVSAMITAPINKAALALAGSRFAGHTELLAERTRTRRYAMMMAGERLRVVLVTIHLPLRDVPKALDPARITETIVLTAQALQQRFGFSAPRLAVAGFNPHAGENGLFGDEETRLITPAIARAQQATGLTMAGPLPPDTVFFQAAAGRFEAVICMYHDQGLIPFKMIHFSDGVNTTLGLPIIRTSVDHGTAYEIAGTGQADPGSLLAAIRLAADQARQDHTEITG